MTSVPPHDEIDPKAGIERQVLAYLRETIHPAVELDTKLVADGLLDSFQSIALIDHFEQEFGIQVNPDTIDPEDLDSARASARKVARPGPCTGTELERSRGRPKTPRSPRRVHGTRSEPRR